MPRHLVALLVILAWIGLSPPAQALLDFSLEIGSIEGVDWHARGVSLEWREPASDQVDLQITVSQLLLPGGHGEVRTLVLGCNKVRRSAASWACSDGHLAVAQSAIGQQDAAWEGEFRSGGEIDLSIPRLEVAGGSIALALQAQNGVWSLRVTPQRTSVADTAALIGAALPPEWRVKGRLSGAVELFGEAATITRLDADLVIDRVHYAAPDGLQAAEDIVLRGSAKAQNRSGRWHFDAKVLWPKGALYSDPLFLDAAKGRVDLAASGSWRPDSPDLKLDNWSVDIGDTVEITGLGHFAGSDLTMMNFTVVANSGKAGQLYRRLLQPFLIGTVADDLDAEGHVGLVLHFDREGVEQAGLELNHLALADRQGRFAVDRTSGSVAWDRRKTVPVSHLSIDGASVYRIATGPFNVVTRFAGDRVDLVEPVVVPMLGGSLALDSFSLQGALVAGDKPQWQASASLRNVSLEQLTAALEWQPFEGTVSGGLQDMRYSGRQLSVGGGLMLDAFDGRIRVDDLTLQDPFGTVPILTAAATMRGLSLEALTRTFSFGRIEGRLDGDLEGLRMVAWEPDRFDLHLYTPADDDSRHRISQRAVENLTELGSGVPAGLSTGLLSIFEEFRYDRIDLSIDLRGNVAEIGGLARPDGGYYLLKGSGLPRIDVIGRNRSVAWRDLIERLRQIQVEGAQIR